MTSIKHRPQTYSVEEMSEDDENVPLLPSLEEEFDEDSDVTSSKVTVAKNEEGLCHCTGTLKSVIFLAVGVAVLVVVIGIVLGVTLPLLKVAHRSSSSDSSTSPTAPGIHSTASSATMQSSYLLSTTSETFHTITATSVIHITSASDNSMSSGIHSSSIMQSMTLTSQHTLHTTTGIITPTPTPALSSFSSSSLHSE